MSAVKTHFRKACPNCELVLVGLIVSDALYLSGASALNMQHVLDTARSRAVLNGFNFAPALM